MYWKVFANLLSDYHNVGDATAAGAEWFIRIRQVRQDLEEEKIYLANLRTMRRSKSLRLFSCFGSEDPQHPRERHD